jgi:hypothetical protein
VNVEILADERLVRSVARGCDCEIEIEVYEESSIVSTRLSSHRTPISGIPLVQDVMRGKIPVMILLDRMAETFGPMALFDDGSLR